MLVLIGAYGYFGLGSALGIALALFAVIPASAVLLVQLNRGSWELIAHVYSTEQGRCVEVRQPPDAFVDALHPHS